MLRKKSLVLIGAVGLFLISGAIFYSAPFGNSGDSDSYTSLDISRGVASVPGTYGQADQPTQSAVTLHWGDVLQNVDGFGGSFAFKKAECLMRVAEPQRTRLLDMIFSREKGIGVSIVRLMIGDEGSGDAEIIEPEKGAFVWNDPDWETKKADFDKGQVWLVNEAKKRGVTAFMGTAWSPPAWMKTNNEYNGNSTGRLKPECYQDYADYLAEYVLGYKKHFNIDISYVSIANEPSIAPQYPGCLWTPDEMNLFIRDYLGPTFEAKGVKAGIVMPESMNFDEYAALPALNDPKTANYIDVIGTHAYGMGPYIPEFTASREKGKPVWQTEYMNQGAELQTYEDDAITDGLKYAGLIGNMFTTARISAYFYWWLAANNGADGSDLIRLCTDGEPGSPTENGLFRVFKRYYAFGNYSRFVRPGFRMIKTDGGSEENIVVTAFKEPASGNFAVIAVNNNPGTVAVSMDLEDFPAGAAKMAVYRTSDSENLKKLNDVAASGNILETELKGRSITTFVAKKFELAALDDMKDVFSVFEAEENDGISDGLKTAVTGNGGKMITGVRNGSFIKYAAVNFADGSASGIAEKKSVLFMNALIAPRGGGKIEVRLDDPVKGKIAGTFNISKSDGNDQWITVSTRLDTSPGGAVGLHDIYLVFKGGKDSGMFDVDSFSFSDEKQPEQ